MDRTNAAKVRGMCHGQLYRMIVTGLVNKSPFVEDINHLFAYSDTVRRDR